MTTREASFQAFVTEQRAKAAIPLAAQAADPQTPSPTAPTVTLEHVVATINGKEVKAPVRMRSIGYGCCIDRDIEEILLKQGAIIHYTAPAMGRGFVGTITGGELTEHHYTLVGQPWYMYVALSSGGDTWLQEWWVSHDRLTAKAAAYAIQASRHLAYPDSYPALADKGADGQ